MRERGLPALLRRDIEGVARFSDPRHPDLGKWLAYWRENPVRAWTEGKHGRWFEVKGDRYLFCPERCRMLFSIRPGWFLERTEPRPARRAS